MAGGFVDNSGNVKLQLKNAEKVTVEWASGVDAEIIRGATDTDRTAIALRRSDGTKVYLYVDTGTTLVVSTTAP